MLNLRNAINPLLMQHRNRAQLPIFIWRTPRWKADSSIDMKRNRGSNAPMTVPDKTPSLLFRARTALDAGRGRQNVRRPLVIQNAGRAEGDRTVLAEVDGEGTRRRVRVTTDARGPKSVTAPGPRAATAPGARVGDVSLTLKRTCAWLYFVTRLDVLR
jgi:hypothetical protein